MRFKTIFITIILLLICSITWADQKILKTETEGIAYLKAKTIPDPKSWNQKLKKTTHEIILKDETEVLKAFEDWLELKKHMFAPSELIALRGYDHRGNKGQINQNVRNHYINVFVDWAEKKPRRQALIIVDVANKVEAEQIANQINLMGNGNSFSLELSSDGKESISHYSCTWNCSASEYEYFESINQPWFKVFNAKDINEDQALLNLGLKRIIKEEIKMMK